MYSKSIIGRTLVVFLFASTLYSCTSALYEPGLKEVKDEVLLSELKEGRKKYIQKCGSCHNLYLPEKYTKTEWEDWLGKMEKRAKLSEKDKSVIFKYLTYGK
ncbi:MAG: hypothetical protein ACOYN6_07535 [Ignavibacteria bacterium]